MRSCPGPRTTSPWSASRARRRRRAEAYVVGVGDGAKARPVPGIPRPAARRSRRRWAMRRSASTPPASPPRARATRPCSGTWRRSAPPWTRSREGRPGSRAPTEDAARADLPDVRLAEVYLSRAGVSRFLGGRRLAARPSSTPSSTTARPRGWPPRASPRRRGRGQPGQRPRPQARAAEPDGVRRACPPFEPALADEAGPRRSAYIGVGELGAALNKALATAGAGAQGLAGSLRALAQSLQKEAGVDPLKDLLPALGGQAALVAEPTDAVPYASLIVDGVDEEKANDALASLQQPLLRSRSGPGARQVPSFQTQGGRRRHRPLRPDLAQRRPLLRGLRRQAGDLHAARGDRPGALERRQPRRHRRLPGGHGAPPGPRSRR